MTRTTIGIVLATSTFLLAACNDTTAPRSASTSAGPSLRLRSGQALMLKTTQGDKIGGPNVPSPNLPIVIDPPLVRDSTLMLPE
jgi:hypothetical protein